MQSGGKGIYPNIASTRNSLSVQTLRTSRCNWAAFKCIQCALMCSAKIKMNHFNFHFIYNDAMVNRNAPIRFLRIDSCCSMCSSRFQSTTPSPTHSFWWSDFSCSMCERNDVRNEIIELIVLLESMRRIFSSGNQRSGEKWCTVNGRRFRVKLKHQLPRFDLMSREISREWNSRNFDFESSVLFISRKTKGWSDRHWCKSTYEHVRLWQMGDQIEDDFSRAYLRFTKNKGFPSESNKFAPFGPECAGEVNKVARVV